MDEVYHVGTQKLFCALSDSALQRFCLSTKHVHFDTTSVNVYGEYLNAADEVAPFKIVYGYSKDKRPDLKQFVLSLLCVDGNVPIVGKLEDGNASDKKINHRVLSEVSQHMNQHGIADEAFIYVADAALVTEENLAQARRFITRLPATYNECERAILAAVDADRWTDVGCIAVTPATKNRPTASYRVYEEAVTLYDKPYRAIVVHSSAHDKRRQKTLGTGTHDLIEESQSDGSGPQEEALLLPSRCRTGGARADGANHPVPSMGNRDRRVPSLWPGTAKAGRPTYAHRHGIRTVG